MTDDISKTSRSKKTRYVILLSVALFILAAFGLPFLKSDGTEKFNGKEAEAGRLAIKNGYDHSPAGTLPDITPAFKAHIMSVSKNPLNKKCGPGENGLVYIVDISKVTFFGIEQPGYENWVCVE